MTLMLLILLSLGLLGMVVLGGGLLSKSSGTNPYESDQTERAHQDARQFARLLIAEILLYNQTKVEAGRRNRNLYEMLKPDLDKARKSYDKRVSTAVAAECDYLHEEIVTKLAGGEVALLGDAYPYK